MITFILPPRRLNFGRTLFVPKGGVGYDNSEEGLRGYLWIWPERNY